jgi:PKD repeat protein
VTSTAGGSNTATQTGYITVSDVPLASFYASETSGTAPFTVEFTDTSTNSPTSWSWDFGDDETSAEQNPSHTYTNPGTYSVSLTAENSAGINQSLQSDYLTVSTAPVAEVTMTTTATPTPEPTFPTLSFSGTPTSGTAPLTVQFTLSTSGAPTSWSWDFGDGGTSTERDPTYTYVIPGTYTVILTANYPEGSNPVTKSSYITVNRGSGSANSPLTPLAPLGAIGIMGIVSLMMLGRKRH